MQTGWLVLTPALLVVFLALMTRRIVFSLLSGITLAALILHNFQVMPAVSTVASRIWSSTELGYLTSWHAFFSAWYLFICLFLIVLGIMISMINQAGGAYAYGNFIAARLKSQKNVECSCLLLSLLFFVDDYFSSLTVGSVMQPITDQFKIPRVKLALLISTVAAPLAVLFPISSWSADIVMQLRQSGISSVDGQAGVLISADPFSLYLSVIPFLFYSIITIVCIWFVVIRRLSFGLLKKHESAAQKTGNLFAGKIAVVKRMSEVVPHAAGQAHVMDFLLPIVLLFGGVIAGIAVLGFGKVPIALFLGSLVATLVSGVYLFLNKRLKSSQIIPIISEGAQMMLPSIMVLVLIWTLSSLLKNDLASGQYLADLLIGHIDTAFFPVVFFYIATLISAMMGSAWGTIGILIAIAVPMLVSFAGIVVPASLDQLPMLAPMIASIISGAVAGNHLSPIADIMLMSATSAGAYHLDLVKAQMTFAVPMLISTGISFAIVGCMIQIHGALIAIATALGVGLLVGCGALRLMSLFGGKIQDAGYCRLS